MGRIHACARAVAILVATALLACGRSGGEGAGDGGVAGTAQALLDADTLPPRAEVLRVAQSLAAEAARLGGVEGGKVASDAARIFERSFRRDGQPQDGQEAASLFSAAGAVGDCSALVRAGLLRGELAHQPSVAYAELVRAERRHARSVDGGAAPCAARLAAELARLRAVRPSEDVLAAIDRGLEGEALLEKLAASPPREAEGPPRVLRIEHWPSEHTSRTVIYLDRAATFRVGDEGQGEGPQVRTYVELDGVALPGAPTDQRFDGIVSHVSAEGTGTGSRVLLRLAGPAMRRAFHLAEPFRIVVDVAVRRESSSGRSVSRVVLDPGHGGHDPGAIGPTGLREKDVVVELAKLVAPQLERRGIRVALTRVDDRFVPLEERTARANAFGADLFLSIHCNAADNHAKRGVESYVLDTDHGEMASRIAARENATTVAATRELAEILATMRMADQSSRSRHFAEMLQRSAMASLGGFSGVANGGVHPAGFYVLVGARMPAALFEASYISNAEDEALLGSAASRQRFADAIVNAIVAYRDGR